MCVKYCLLLSTVFLIPEVVIRSSFAQFFAPSINSVPLPVGAGARALGQGGAFIAVADDATAVSWNPGALTRLKRPEFSLAGSYLTGQQDFDSETTGSNWFTFDNESSSHGDLNYAGFAYPFRIFRKNFVVALNYQQKFDFHKDLDFSHSIRDLASPSLNFDEKIKFRSDGGIGALTPAISMMVTPKLSMGVAVNFYTDEFFGNYAWKNEVHVTGSGDLAGFPVTEDIVLKEKSENFRAINASIGLLYDVWEKGDKLLTFGAVYHTPYTAEYDQSMRQNGVGSFAGGFFPLDIPETRTHFEIDCPQSFGAGFGFRYNDSLSCSLDVTWTDWSDYQREDEDGNKTRPLGSDVSTSKRIGDTFAVRTGTEYLIFRDNVVIPARAGLFYEPRVSLDSPTDVYGFSVGSGISTKRVSFDGAYQFRWSTNGEGEDFQAAFEGMQFDIREHVFLASISVYF